MMTIHYMLVNLRILRLKKRHGMSRMLRMHQWWGALILRRRIHRRFRIMWVIILCLENSLAC